MNENDKNWMTRVRLEPRPLFSTQKAQWIMGRRFNESWRLAISVKPSRRLLLSSQKISRKAWVRGRTGVQRERVKQNKNKQTNKESID